ncbi:MAG: 4-alpha-glucanotransferase [Saprospiraceae bacterium]|nr:4-alpha-glucanotransferase [Saprospiraceae bacterium]MBP7680171.1 4-alpha-glucanotransferase [Saprospiraceae bacterium]
MLLHFHIHYKTTPGQLLQLVYHTGKKLAEATANLQTFDGEHWTVTLEAQAGVAIRYKYATTQSSGSPQLEFGEWRHVAPSTDHALFLCDYWRPYDTVDNAFFSAAFKDVVFKRKKQTAKPPALATDKNYVTFRLFAAYIAPHQKFCIIGNIAELGEWDETKAIVLNDANFPYWETTLPVGDTINVTYKYAIWDTKTKKLTHWETDDDRKLNYQLPLNGGQHLIVTDEKFRYPFGGWRGAGVAIPVFSLRSNEGFGIGEFTDLRLLIDWAKAANLQLVQTLPINDTIATKTWLDSYPYAAISVFALHPLYVNLKAFGELKDKQLQKEFVTHKTTLNALQHVDFEQVLQYKFQYFKAVFKQEKATIYNNKVFAKFIADHAEWLKPYAIFCYLRDKNKTANFNTWEQYNTYYENIIPQFFDTKNKAYDEVMLYCYIQFKAHEQLGAITDYARTKGIVLKGDLPIGIYRYSCDAWVAPHLYNMDEQAGAPPDVYSAAGQNWGFPTYNWSVMAQDGFAWWRKRMDKLAEFFDALRIDHILGFFRIWQIPMTQVEGTLGMFNPRLPLSRDEIYSNGLWLNDERYCKPYIHKHFLRERFGDDTDWAIETFLTAKENWLYDLKPEVDTQQKIKALFAKKYPDKKRVEKGLQSLVGELLFIEEPASNGQMFNPRITLYTTQSYKDLDAFDQFVVQKIYDLYYFQRHEDFWKQQALWKLPALLNATNMLICGEDLGMIPSTVPSVMRDLNILTLEIQRMPKGETSFADTKTYPYGSVCSPSSHDMSTIRGWWEGDYKTAQLFYNTELGQSGIAPRECSSQIVQAIIQQHLASPSMWAVFPLQDIVGTSDTLRWKDAFEEQINEPSNPQHYWRYRFHIPIEQLLTEDAFTEKVAAMMQREVKDAV